MSKKFHVGVDIIGNTNMPAISNKVLSSTNKLGKALDKANRAQNLNRGAFGQATVAADRFARALGVGVVAAFGYSIYQGMKFESALRDLSAITGIVGKDLDTMSAAAMNMSMSTGYSGTKIMEAMKLIASGKSELIGVEGAIEGVTEKTLTLARAANIPVVDATKAMITSMNQFAFGADQAARVANVLAIGAKLGASEIKDTGMAMIRAGVASRVANVSFEATNAALQVLAKNGLKGVIAGTQLKTAFLHLVRMSGEFNPQVVGLNTALDNLNDAQFSATELSKIFGLESLAAGVIMMENRKLIKKWTEEFTGTNEAYKQAEINSKQLKVSLDKLKSGWDVTSIKVYNKYLAKPLTVMADLLASMLKLGNQNKAYRRLLEGTALAIGAVTASLLSLWATFQIMRFRKWLADMMLVRATLALVRKEALMLTGFRISYWWADFTGILTTKVVPALVSTGKWIKATAGTFWTKFIPANAKASLSSAKMSKGLKKMGGAFKALGGKISDLSWELVGNLSKAWKTAKTASKKFAIEIGGKVLKNLKIFGSAVAEVAGKITGKLVKGIVYLGVKLGILAPIQATAATSAGVHATAVSASTKAIAANTTAVAANSAAWYANPIVWAVVAVVALIAALGTLVWKWNDIRLAMEDAGKVGEGIIFMMDRIKPPGEDINWWGVATAMLPMLMLLEAVYRLFQLIGKAIQFAFVMAGRWIKGVGMDFKEHWIDPIIQFLSVIKDTISALSHISGIGKFKSFFSRKQDKPVPDVSKPETPTLTSRFAETARAVVQPFTGTSIISSPPQKLDVTMKIDAEGRPVIKKVESSTGDVSFLPEIGFTSPMEAI